MADVAQAAGWQVVSVDYAALTGQVDAPAELCLHALLQLLATGLPPHSQLALVCSVFGADQGHGGMSQTECVARFTSRGR